MKKLLLTVFFAVLALCSFAVAASAKEAYLEPIPENLLWEGDTVTHFIVFDDEKYYIGSGNTLNQLNTEEIEKSLASLGISSSDIGNTYLTKFVFPAYLGENLITYFNVNSSIKTNKYFKNVCGYVSFPGTMTKTHDMNQCVDQLRGIDFGKNSQLISIPFCFAKNANKLKEVKNFPTAKLDTIEGDAFNGTRQAFRGDLIINARVIREGAFNNATTFVTSLVFGENVTRIETQAFSVKSSETGLGSPRLEYIEFKSDVSIIETTSFGPFYFELGGSSRSEYTSLKCIVLSNESNKKAIENGAKVFDDLAPSSYIRFFLDTTKEIITSSHNISFDNATVSYDSFLESGTITGICANCGKSEAISAPALFDFKGISVPANGDIEIYIAFSANYDAIEQYEKITGNTVNFGIVAAAQAVLGSNMPLDENGNEVELENGVVIKAPVNNAIKYASYELRINGFTTDAHKDVMLLMASYVHITDIDGNTISVNYLQSKQVVNNGFIFVSYNSYGK
ncbi:MAG: hypothetical protein II984_07875 [Clostridia bacterium]|nr:hypothetical protein [Clostridia bacterium]